MTSQQLIFKKITSNVESKDLLLNEYGQRVTCSDFTTIDWIHDNTKERGRQRALSKIRGIRGILIRAWDASTSWISVLLIGTITGLIAGYINISAEWLSDIKEGYCSTGFYLKYKFCCQYRENNCSEWISWDQNWILGYVIFTSLAVGFALLSGLFVSNYAPYAAGSGIPEVKTILGGFVIRGFLSLSTLLIKVVCLILSVASGMALGKEGPLVHVACCVGQIIPSLFKKYSRNEAKMREMLSVASATGVSVAFGAPIGSFFARGSIVLFSLQDTMEVIYCGNDWCTFTAIC